MFVTNNRLRLPLEPGRGPLELGRFPLLEPGRPLPEAPDLGSTYRLGTVLVGRVPPDTVFDVPLPTPKPSSSALKTPLAVGWVGAVLNCVLSWLGRLYAVAVRAD